MNFLIFYSFVVEHQVKKHLKVYRCIECHEETMFLQQDLLDAREHLPNLL